MIGRIIAGVVLIIVYVSCFANSSGLLIDVTTNGRTLTLSPAANHSYLAASIQITTPGFSFENGSGRCEGNYCSFSFGANNPAVFTINGLSGQLSFKACLNGKKEYSCQNYGISVPQYPYVADTLGNMYICDFDNQGDFINCIVTPTVAAPAWAPRNSAFTSTNSSTYGYVVGDDTYQCTLNQNGTFSSCSPAITQVWNPAGIAFATVNGVQYAYIADNSESAFKCYINSNDGGLYNCAVTPQSNAPGWTPGGISFAG